MDIKLFSQEQLCSAEPILPGQLHIWIMPNSGGHAILHQLLGFYLSCSPDDLLFKKGAHGKPELSGKHAGKIHFNLSHSGDQLALIFSVDSPVGIDIEKIHPVKKKSAHCREIFPPGRNTPSQRSIFHGFGNIILSLLDNERGICQSIRHRTFHSS